MCVGSVCDGGRPVGPWETDVSEYGKGTVFQPRVLQLELRQYSSTPAQQIPRTE